MPFIHKPTSNSVPVIGLFAPCDPRSDGPSRERAQSIVAMTAKILSAIKLPGGFGKKADKPGIYVASRTVENEAHADEVASEFKQNGVEVIAIVLDARFSPGKTAIALTAHFPSAPLCCIAGNSAPRNSAARPGVSGVDAVVGAYAQSGRLCHAMIGNLPDKGHDPSFDDKSKAEIIDLVWAMTAAQWLKGEGFLASTSAAMQIETAPDRVHAICKHFGIESVRESQKLFSDLVRTNGGYDPKELNELVKWTVDVQWKDRIYPDIESICAKQSPIYADPARVKPRPLTAGRKARLQEQLKLYLILRNHMSDLNCIGGGWTSQLASGSGRRARPLACADLAAALCNSTLDHRGRKNAIPFATESDVQDLLTMLCYSALTGGEPIRSADHRRVYEPWEIQKKADELGIRLDPKAAYLLRGAIDMSNSGSGSLDWCTDSTLFEVFRHSFPGGGFSTGYISPGGIGCQVGRLVYSELTGTCTMIQGEAESVSLPQPIAEAFCHASSYSWPHTWITFTEVPASLAKYGCPGDHLHLVRNLPTRRWQYFSDYTHVLNHRWEGTPEFTEGRDRPLPLIYRISGGEQMAKMRLGCRV